MVNLTLLETDDIKTSIFEENGAKCAITDFAILLGGNLSRHIFLDDSNNKIERTGVWWTKTLSGENTIYTFDESGEISFCNTDTRIVGTRPIISQLFSIHGKVISETDSVVEIEYGEYPQNVVSVELSDALDIAYENKLIAQTEQYFTTDSISYLGTHTKFTPRQHKVFKLDGIKYVPFYGDINGFKEVLSNGERVQLNKRYWVEVKPIEWVMDKKSGLMVSKKILFAGVQFKNGPYDGNFENADIKLYMNSYFSKEIAQYSSYWSSGESSVLDVLGNKIMISKASEKNEPLTLKLDILSLQDVISHNYSEDRLSMSTAEKIMTAISLLSVDEEHFDLVREFLGLLGEEIRTIFEAKWVGQDETRLKMLKECQQSLKLKS